MAILTRRPRRVLHDPLSKMGLVSLTASQLLPPANLVTPPKSILWMFQMILSKKKKIHIFFWYKKNFFGLVKFFEKKKKNFFQA